MLDVKVDRIVLLGGGGSGGSRAGSIERAPATHAGTDESPADPITDDDIPF
jgi:hypothetical protein